MRRNNSRQRQAIMDFLSTRKDHPTAETVYDNVRIHHPNISLGTVYRNLNLLADSNEIKRIRTRDSKDHFDADTSPHYHFMCNQCFQVSDIFIDMTAQLTQEAEQETDCKILEHEAFYYGLCATCLHEAE